MLSLTFNLHTDQHEVGIKRSRDILRALIDAAIAQQGSYFPTYHKFANKQQVITCYPGFVAFLQDKLNYDPTEVFQTNWYRHYKKMFACELVEAY